MESMCCGGRVPLVGLCLGEVFVYLGALAPPMSDENMLARLFIICGFDAMFCALL